MTIGTQFAGFGKHLRETLACITKDFVVIHFIFGIGTAHCDLSNRIKM